MLSPTLPHPRSVRDKLVALLLVGQTFRSPSRNGNPGLPTATAHPCSHSNITWRGQREATLSYKVNILDELVAAGAEVLVLMTVPRCSSPHFLRALLEWLGPRKARATACIRGTSS
jgi:hypothetical protein